jgi:outer membrane lipoprotein-sorting protein
MRTNRPPTALGARARAAGPDRRLALAAAVLALTAATGLSWLARAQATPTVQQVLANVERAQAGWRDISAVVAGTITGADGSNTDLELEIQAIPAERLSRIFFVRPDSLADNYTVIDNDTVYNYLALTNQVVIQTVEQAAREQGGHAFDLSDLQALVPENRFERSLAGTENTPAGRAFRLEARALNPAAEGLSKIIVWILDQSWRPHRVQLLDERGGTLADITVRSWRTGVGLQPARLRTFPADAQVSDQRR